MTACTSAPLTQLIQLAQTRHTCKAFDPERKIPQESIDALLTLLRYSPSSVNSQPGHFVVAASEAGKARVAKATQAAYPFNEGKIRNASHLIVLCTRTDLDEAHLAALLAQETQDGRLPDAEARAMQDKTRRFYLAKHRDEHQDLPDWLEKQVYLALGTLLLGAASLHIDTCTMEGFDAATLDEELDLRAQGYRSSVIVPLGYRSAADFNAKLPKSRLPASAIIRQI